MLINKEILLTAVSCRDIRTPSVLGAPTHTFGREPRGWIEKEDGHEILRRWES